MPDQSEYFDLDPERLSKQPGQFVDVEADAPRVQFSAGLSFRPVLGERVMANFVSFEPNTEAPMHAHDEEQITVVLEGELEFTVGNETRTLTSGQVAVIPPNAPHRARTRDQSCLEIDVFAPPRRALLDLLDDGAPPTS